MNKVYVTTYFNSNTNTADTYQRVNQTEMQAILLAHQDMELNAGDYQRPNEPHITMAWKDGAFNISLMNKTTGDELEAFVITEAEIGE